MKGLLGCKDPLEDKMAIHSSILAWKITWTEEPGGLQSMGSQRVGHDRATECVCTHTHTQMHDQSTESRKLALCEDVRQGFTEV